MSSSSDQQPSDWIILLTIRSFIRHYGYFETVLIPQTPLLRNLLGFRLHVRIQYIDNHFWMADWRQQPRPIIASMQKVGDSSAPNLAFWNHLSSTGIDDWAKLHNSGWDCDGLFPHLVKAGTLTLPQETDLYISCISIQLTMAAMAQS